MSIELIKNCIRDIPDFPQKGILFRDITPILSNYKAFSEVIDIMEERYMNSSVTKIVAIESRGFLFGAVLAQRLGVGLVLVRKKGKLPFKTVEASYDLEYGSATVEMHVDSLTANDSVVIVDDLLATGGTAAAAVELVNKFGSKILGLEFVIELKFLDGRKMLKNEKINSIVAY